MSKKAIKHVDSRGDAVPEGPATSAAVVESDTVTREDMVHAVAEEVMGRMLSCGSCKFWARTGPSFGQCMLSGKYGSSPIVTTDKASCSSWTE